MSKTLQNKGDSLEIKIADWVNQNHDSTNDKSQNKLTNILVKKYKVKLYTLALYGLFKASNNQMGLKDMSYKEVDELIKELHSIKTEQIENSIKQEFNGFVCKKIDSQIHNLVLGSFLVFILLILLPVLDWKIYRWWMKKKVKGVES